MKKIHIYWSRRDFRLMDNRALSESVKNARKNGDFFLPLFILEDYMTLSDSGQFGYPQKWFLSRALPQFADNFENFICLKGKIVETFLKLKNFFKKNDIEMIVYVNEDIHPLFFKQIKKLLTKKINIKIFKDQLTIDPSFKTGAGNFYSVFTPFKKAVWTVFLNTKPINSVSLKNLNYFKEKISNEIKINSDIMKLMSSKKIIKINDQHKIDLDSVLKIEPDFSFWYTNEKQALKIFDNYLKNNLVDYKVSRDFLEMDEKNVGTSKMSLGLAWGLISARTICQKIQKHFETDFNSINWYAIPKKYEGPVTYISELIWREFYKYLLYNMPNLLEIEFQEKYRNNFKWVDEETSFKRFVAWIKGETGYPIVDAAMNQIAKTGWMHNRVRMIVASVLTKNFGVDWRWGQEYFRAQLIDLGDASNNGGWQWSASVGADPKPIRIFNPYLQASKYDKNKKYQKKWLQNANEVTPIIEHKKAREEALKRYYKN